MYEESVPIQKLVLGHESEYHSLAVLDTSVHVALVEVGSVVVHMTSVYIDAMQKVVPTHERAVNALSLPG
jgi:hypothetical protein